MRPVETRSHLVYTVRYVLRQAAHHGIDPRRSLERTSSFPDLVGARWRPELGPAALLGLLPRVDGDEWWEMMGLTPLRGASDGMVAAAGALRVAAAAARAVGHDDLRGRTPEVVAAATAAVALSRAVGLAPEALSKSIGRSVRQIRRLAADSASTEVMGAIRLQLALDDVELPRVEERRPRPGHVA